MAGMPTSENLIKSRLGHDKLWIMENLRKCIDYATSKGFEVTVGLEDATRSEMKYLIEFM